MGRDHTNSYAAATPAPQPPKVTDNQGAWKASRLRSVGRDSADSWPRLVAERVHQMSQPLTALQGTVELALLSERTAEGYRAALEESWEQLTRLNGIVSSLRDLADAHVQSSGPKGRVLRLSVSRGPFEAAALAVEVPRRVRPPKKAGSSLPVSAEETSPARRP